MRWSPGGENEDVEDRRGESGGGGGGGFGFGGGGGFGGIHLGIGGTLIVLVLSLVFRTNLFQFLGNGGGDQGATVRSERPVSSEAGEERSKQLMVYVLRDVQKTWEKLLPAEGVQYRHAKLDLYRDSIRSACGQAESATGPFYCPEDEKVYIDLGFFDQLRTKFGAPGEFAQSYVLAHEIGHHVQKLLGIEGKVRRLQERDPSQENPLSVPHRSRGLQTLRHVVLVDDLPLLGAMRPHPRETVCLQFQADRKGILLARVPFLQPPHFALDSQ